MSKDKIVGSSKDKGDLTSPAEIENGRKKLTYSWDTTPELLEEYFRIRQESYASYLGLKHFTGKLDWFDINSHILLVKDGDKCVGGARITEYNPEVTPHLPLECDDFILKDALPELHLENCKYAELSRLAILPEYRKIDSPLLVYRHILDKFMGIGLRYLFSVAPLSQSRVYKLAANRINKKATIREDIDLPDKPVYEGIKMYLSIYEDMPAVEGGE